MPLLSKRATGLATGLATLLATSLALCILTAAATAQTAAPYRYFRIGSAQDAVTKSEPGYALMGGGTDLDDAFRWLCTRAHGGDFLVLRAAGSDAYNPYVFGLQAQPLCKLNSVATLILPDRASANDPFAAATIAHAEAIFIAGGDQSNYTRNWTGTPVQTALNAAIARGVPIGGTSAGLAVLGEWAYSAEGDKPDDPNLDSKTALANPLGPRITLTHNFLNIPALRGIVTDTHFATRDRMGRLLVFVARTEAQDQTRGLGIEQGAAILLEPDGEAKVIGKGSAYLVEITHKPAVLEDGKPLPDCKFSVKKLWPGQTFNLSNPGKAGTGYTLSVESSVEAGVIHSSQPNNALY